MPYRAHWLLVAVRKIAIARQKLLCRTLTP